MDLIKISVSDDFEVDYNKERGMYRVSVFEDGHFWDEYWFDAYEEKELDDFFPHTIGDITYYSKEELFEWIINQQKSNKNCLSEALKNYKLVECKFTDEELEEFLDKWNSIGCTSFRLSSEEIEKCLDKAKQDLIEEGYDLEELKKYVD